MAITFQQVVQTAAASGSSFNINITPNSAGDLLILCIGMYQKGLVTSVTDNNGNSWIPVIYNVEAGNGAGAIYHVPSCHAGATTITVNLLASEVDVGLIVTEYSGCAIHHPVDGFSIGSGSSGTSLSTANLTTAQSNDVIFSFAAFVGQNIASIGTGFTLRSSLTTNNFSATGDEAAATPGTYAGTWNSAASGNYLLMAVGLSSVDNPAPLPVPVQFALNEALSAGSPITATFSNNVTEGNAIVVLCLSSVTTMTFTGVTDSEGNTYTPCTLAASAAGTAMFVAFNAAGGTAAAVHATYTGTFGAAAVYAIEVRDVNAYDTGSAGTSTSATAATGAFTLSKSQNEIVIAATINADSALDPGGNESSYFLIQTTSSFADVVEYLPGVTGSQNAQANLNGSQLWSMIGGGFYYSANTSNAVPKDALMFGTLF
jgi:hypothetical protein